MDSKSFYRKCEKKESGDCTNSKTHCGVQFKYIIGSNRVSMEALMNDITFLSCPFLQKIQANEAESSAGTNTQLDVLYAVIGLLGAIIVLLLIAIATYFGVKTYRRRNPSQVTWYIQGDHSGCVKPPVAIETKVAF